MRAVSRFLLGLTILLLAGGAARAATPSEDARELIKGFSDAQATQARYLYEQEVRQREGKGSILQAAADNDIVTGVLNVAGGKVAGRVLGDAAGDVIGNIPVDDIARVVYRGYKGDREGAIQAYATGWVGFLAGAIAGAGTEWVLTGTAVAVSAPLPLVAAGVGIGVSCLAKRCFEWLMAQGKPSPVDRTPDRTPNLSSIPFVDAPLTPDQIRDLKTRLASHDSALPRPAIPASMPDIASHSIPVSPPVAPIPPDQDLSVPVFIPADPATGPIAPQLPDPKLPLPVEPTAKQPASTTTTTEPPPPVKAKPVSPVAKPYVVYCVCCKHELALPRGQKVPPACPSCGRAKARIYGSNPNGQKVLMGTVNNWYWPKGSKTGLSAGQWFE